MRCRKFGGKYTGKPYFLYLPMRIRTNALANPFFGDLAGTHHQMDLQKVLIHLTSRFL